MEEEEKIKSNIKKYILSSPKYDNKKDHINIELKRIGGYSNLNYMGIIKDSSTNEIIEHIFYRQYCSKFGCLSDSINHEQESKITKYLSEKNYGPKILFEEKNNFCISEFLTNTQSLPPEKYYDENITEQLCTILNYFTTFSHIYKYEINDGKIKLMQVKDNDNDERKIDLTKNQYEKIVVDLYEKAIKSFQIFYDKFIQKYLKDKNPNEYKDVELVKNFLENYKQIYNDNFQSKGFLVMNHGDVFCDNILYREKDEKIFLIDHEYFTLNLLGYDLAYYLVESFVKYEPELMCDFDKINFDAIFPIYEKFVNKFINNYQSLLEKEEFGKEFLERIKTKEYFITRMNIANLYLFIWTIGNIDFDSWEKNSKKEFFFIHGVKRIEFYLLGKNAIEKLKHN